MNDGMSTEEKITLTTTLGLTALRELLIKKQVFTRAEWTEMLDKKQDEFEDMLRRNATNERTN